MLENPNYIDCPCGACKATVLHLIEAMRCALKHPDKPIYWKETHLGLEPQMGSAAAQHFIDVMCYAVEHPDKPIYWSQTYQGLEPQIDKAQSKARAVCSGGTYKVKTEESVSCLTL